MAIATSMGGNLLDIRYGDRLSAPQYNGVLLNSIVSDVTKVQSCVAGRVYSLTSAGFLVPGIKNGTADATGGTIPLFGFTGLDLNNRPASYRTRGMPGNFGPASPWNTGYNASNAFAGVPQGAGLQGPFGCIAHTFAGELATTAFDPAGTYTPGAALTALSVAATDQTLRGRIKVAGANEPIIGYVAPAGKYAGPYGYDLLAFFPAFVAGSAVAPLT